MFARLGMWAWRGSPRRRSRLLRRARGRTAPDGAGVGRSPKRAGSGVPPTPRRARAPTPPRGCSRRTRSPSFVAEIDARRRLPRSRRARGVHAHRRAGRGAPSPRGSPDPTAPSPAARGYLAKLANERRRNSSRWSRRRSPIRRRTWPSGAAPRRPKRARPAYVAPLDRPARRRAGGRPRVRLRPRAERIAGRRRRRPAAWRRWWSDAQAAAASSSRRGAARERRRPRREARVTIAAPQAERLHGASAETRRGARRGVAGNPPRRARAAERALRRGAVLADDLAPRCAAASSSTSARRSAGTPTATRRRRGRAGGRVAARPRRRRAAARALPGTRSGGAAHRVPAGAAPLRPRPVRRDDRAHDRGGARGHRRRGGARRLRARAGGRRRRRELRRRGAAAGGLRFGRGAAGSGAHVGGRARAPEPRLGARPARDRPARQGARRRERRQPARRRGARARRRAGGAVRFAAGEHRGDAALDREREPRVRRAAARAAFGGQRPQPRRAVLSRALSRRFAPRGRRERAEGGAW